MLHLRSTWLDEGVFAHEELEGQEGTKATVEVMKQARTPREERRGEEGRGREGTKRHRDNR